MFDPRKGVKHRAIIRCGAGPAQDRSSRSWSFALEGDARETVALRGIGGVPAAVADSDRLLRSACHSGIALYGRRSGGVADQGGGHRGDALAAAGEA